MPSPDAARNPTGDWCFEMKGGTQLRSLEWTLRLWHSGDYEHVYTTAANGASGSLHRRGAWEVADNRVFCTVAGQCRVSRTGTGPPAVHAAPVKSFQQLVFEIDAAAKTITSVDEKSPIGAPVLQHLSSTDPFDAFLAFKPPAGPHPDSAPVLPVQPDAVPANGYYVGCDPAEEGEEEEEEEEAANGHVDPRIVHDMD